MTPWWCGYVIPTSPAPLLDIVSVKVVVAIVVIVVTESTVDAVEVIVE